MIKNANSVFVLSVMAITNIVTSIFIRMSIYGMRKMEYNQRAWGIYGEQRNYFYQFVRSGQRVC